jgi:hypothetical protein
MAEAEGWGFISAVKLRIKTGFSRRSRANPCVVKHIGYFL